MFRKPLSAAVAAILVLAPGWSQAEPPKPETVEELLVVSKSQDLLESTYKDLDNHMRTHLDQALTQTIGDTEMRRAYVDSFVLKTNHVFRDELNWATFKPMLMRIYSDSYTQEELVGMLDFYKTPAGQAMVNKMPMVMQKTQGEMLQRIGPMVQKMLAASQEAVAEAKKAQKPTSP
ncbi:DUF2059 domain-containing protein [Hydrogenophaga soli]|nr:DUF2059 domain-containing protein [Burkholderiaceae bacterium]